MFLLLLNPAAAVAAAGHGKSHRLLLHVRLQPPPTPLHPPFFFKPPPTPLHPPCPPPPNTTIPSASNTIITTGNKLDNPNLICLKSNNSMHQVLVGCMKHNVDGPFSTGNTWPQYIYIYIHRVYMAPPPTVAAMTLLQPPFTPMHPPPAPSTQSAAAAAAAALAVTAAAAHDTLTARVSSAQSPGTPYPCCCGSHYTAIFVS